MSAPVRLEEVQNEYDERWRRRQLLWLAYLPLVLLEPAMTGAPARLWVAVVAAMIVFVFAFIRALRGTRNGLPFLIVLSTSVGLALTPFDLGAVIFLAYAAGAAAHFRDPRITVAVIAVIVFASAIESWMADNILHFLLGGLLASCVGLLSHALETSRRTSVRLSRANAEIERLSAIAERDRIARDLHDVLGHTLSLIAVKSELAGRLAESSAPAAAAECRDVLNASRTALAEIREVVRGYRAVLPTEVANSRALLAAAGIRADFDVSGEPRPDDVEAALAFALREAVTNVVRYANAKTCRVSLRSTNEIELLEIRDDGRGIHGPEGGGFRGMRERIEAIGGTFDAFSDGGTCVRINVPMHSRKLVRS